jgi:DNA invertase Pin-like site-specific DNA recombinase
MQQPCPYLRYVRMSLHIQNPRSPAQQKTEIDRARAMQRTPWIHVQDYGDEGISGRYEKKRPGFNQMIRDIKTGLVKVDLILVDTFERFGRFKGVAALCDELYHKYGVLVLTADSMFFDPTTPAGQALRAVEIQRATQDAGVKAHNVVRGKRDMADLKQWPGGPAPVGFKLKRFLTPGPKGTEMTYCKLLHDPELKPIVEVEYKLADEKEWGDTRIAQYLNG